jgi:cytochrome c
MARLYGLPEHWQNGYLCGAQSAQVRSRNPTRQGFSSMDSFEVNKIVGAILATFLVMVVLNITAEAVFTAPPPAKPGYEVKIPEKTTTPAAGQPAAPEEPIEKLLASASVERGQMTAKQCATCHTFDKGGPNAVGPNLYGVVGRPRASEPGYNYSAAMKAKGGDWSIDELNKFLSNPQGYIPGINMRFAGLPRGNQRADVIDYLNSLSDNPKPLPVAKE